MAALALKALHHGVEKVPDKFWETIPGGFFTPAERQHTKTKRRHLRESKAREKEQRRRRSEERRGDRGRRRSHRDRSPPTDYSDYSGYDDTDYERDYRGKHRSRRAKSLGRSVSPRDRSFDRGRDRRRGTEFDDEMDRAERGPDYPPQSRGEYQPYNPADYAPAAATGAAVADEYYDRRTSSAKPEYGYAPQPMGSRPATAQSSSAARYTPAGAYAPSPVGGYAPGPAAGYAPPPTNTQFPPPPNAGYAPYNPADYASPAPYRSPGAAYPSPPPFYRQSSHSQPSLAQYPQPDNQLAYAEAPSRHGSTSSSRHHRRNEDGRHRAKSAGHHGRSSSRMTDQLRDRFDSMDIHDKDLAASAAGALAGGIAGRAVGHGTLSTLVGAAIGGVGARELEKRHEMKKAATREASRGSGQSRLADRSQESSRRRQSSRSRRREYSRSPSPDRRKDDYDDYSESGSDSDGPRRRASRKRRASRRRRDSDY